MEDGQIELLGLISELRELDSLACRICLMRDGDGWSLRNMIVDAVPEGKQASWSLYEYGRDCFVNEVVSGEQLSSWLTSLTAEAKGRRFRIPELQTEVRWTRYTSHARNTGIYGIPLPHTLYQLRSSVHRDRERRDAFTPLVKDGCPSFPNYEAAAFRFLYDLEYRPGNQVPDDVIVIRLAHTEAWIERDDATRIELNRKATETEDRAFAVGTN